MRLPVTDQARFLCERFATDITDIRTFSRVYEQVLPIRCSTRESLAADVTIVRSVPGMSHHVLLQSMILRERFPALLAYETLSPLVLQQNMLIQILLGNHASFANLTLVLWLEMCPLLMHVQRVAVRACFPTNVAYNRPFFMLETHVKPHVAFHLELFPTVLAIVLIL